MPKQTAPKKGRSLTDNQLYTLVNDLAQNNTHTTAKKALRALVAMEPFQGTLKHRLRGYAGSHGCVHSACLAKALADMFADRDCEWTPIEEDFDWLSQKLCHSGAYGPPKIVERTGVFKTPKKVKRHITRFARRVVKHADMKDGTNDPRVPMVQALCMIYGTLVFCEILRQPNEYVGQVLFSGLEVLISPEGVTQVLAAAPAN